MKQQVLKYLRTQKLMALATIEGNKSWSNTAYFAVDNNLNLYFVSPPSSEHCQNILKNQSVSVAIFDSNQHGSSKKIGLQIRGQAKRVKGEKNIRAAIKLWCKVVPGAEKWINYENMKNSKIESKIYQIKPTKIKFFNEILFGEEGTKVLSLA